MSSGLPNPWVYLTEMFSELRSVMSVDQEQENPVFGKLGFSYLMPLFFFTLVVMTGSSLQILDVDFVERR